MSYSHRIFVYGPVGLLALAAIVYVAFWFVAAGRVSDWLENANGSEILPGVRFAFAEKSVGGFPFRLDVLLGGVTLAHAGAAGETAWRAEELAFHRLSYDSERLVFEVDGLQSITWPGGEGKPSAVLYLTLSIARASAILRDGVLARLDIDFFGLEAKDARVEDSQARNATAARAQVHFLVQEENTIAVMFKLDNTQIGGGYDWPLGHDISVLTLNGRLRETQALGSLLRAKRGLSESAEEWRRAGGMLVVETLMLERTGHDEVTLSGRLALNANHQVEGVLMPTKPGGPAFVLGDNL